MRGWRRDAPAGFRLAADLVRHAAIVEGLFAAAGAVLPLTKVDAAMGLFQVGLATTDPAIAAAGAPGSDVNKAARAVVDAVVALQAALTAAAGPPPNP